MLTLTVTGTPANGPGASRLARAAACGEPARLAIGAHDTVARHDRRERIATQRLPDRARQAPVAKLLRNLAVGACVAGSDAARYGIHALMEFRDTGHVERYLAQV